MMGRITILAAVVWCLAALAANAAAITPESGQATSHDGTPDARRSCQPVYLPAARAARAEGVTKLAFQIDADGRIASADVVESSGPTPEHKLLDQEVARAVKGCSLFRRKLDANGQGVPYSITMGYHWGLPPADGSPSKAHPPRLISVESSCKPVYPPAALRAGVQGQTVVEMVVDAAGEVKSAEVVQSAGQTTEHKLLDQAAVEALPRCPYTPGTDTDGKPIGARITVSYVWKLEK
jgi:TonB family protein